MTGYLLGERSRAVLQSADYVIDHVRLRVLAFHWERLNQD